MKYAFTGENMKNKKLNLYILFITILALICIIISFILYKNEKNIFGDLKFGFQSIILFIVLEAFAESFLIYSIKYNPVTISTAFAVTTAAIINFGIFWAIIVVCLGVSLRVIKRDNVYHHIFNIPIYKTLFNMSNMAISTFCAGYIYYNFLGIVSNSDVIVLMIKFILLSFSFLIVNTIIISLLIYFLSGNDKLVKIFVSNFKFGFLNIIFVAPAGIILAFLYSRYAIFGVAIVIIPIISLRYIFKLYIQ